MSPFDSISNKNKIKLLELLEAQTINLNKGLSLTKRFKNSNIIGIVERGSIEISKIDLDGNSNIIDEIYENDVFVINEKVRDEDDIAIKEDNTKIIILDYDYIIMNLGNDKEYFNQFIKNMYVILNEKLKERNKRIEILTKKTIREKILTYLDIEFNKTGSKNIYLPFYLKDLANYLAVDRSAMSRELKNLKDEGFIEVKERRIIILYK